MNLHRKANLSARSRLFFRLLIGVWTGCVAGSLFWNLRQQSDRSLQVARRAAQVTFENDVLYRRWSAKHGGVYVPVTEDTPPNPYLQVADRDVTTTSGVSLTLVNPAYMARQVNALAGATGGSGARLTSSKPIRPENAPDPWEAAALRQFDQGATEVSSVEETADGEHLRLMRPFVAERSCLTCHAAQGFQEGDICGGVGVSIPMAPFRAIENSMNVRLTLAHLGLWLVGLAGVALFRQSLGKEILGRERAEGELRASEQRFRTLFETMTEGFALHEVLVDEQGRPCDYRFLDVNPAFERFAGVKQADLVGKRVLDVLPGSRSRWIEGFAHVAITGEPLYVEDYSSASDRWYSVFAYRTAPRQFAVIFSDVTARKQAEEALRHAKAAAESANQAKSQFLANMSHELRTPMNAILGMIEVALPKATDPTVQDCLQTARGSADLLMTLLNDLLDSTKIESGKLELESAPFSLRRMLDQVAQILSVRASEKGLFFSCHVPDEAPDAVVGDHMRLQQVLLNLAGNAIKFTERGKVEIVLRALARNGEASLEFAVRDTGIGIAPSDRERLFQAFVQADACVSRRFGGTGLGLTISKNLVEMMGGTIRVESKPGQGSTFHFTVRLALAKEAPADSEAPFAIPAVACSKLRILLVEDNPANQKLARYILQGRGHVVEVAGDGREAIDLTERKPFDVILMDIQMPGMDGLEATAAIRKRDEPGRRFPIIAMTAHAMKGDRERCMNAGMDDYLSKPIDAQEMIGLVESLARGASPAAPVPTAAPAAAERPPRAEAAVFRPEVAVARCFHSEEMVQKMIQCFFADVESLFPQMRAAAEKDDLREVGRLGHRMKGSVAFLGAGRAEEAARRVERFCTSSSSTRSEAEEAVSALEHECLTLKHALSHWLACNPTAPASGEER